MATENKHFNIALSIIIVILSISLIYMIYLVNRNEQARIHFELNTINNKSFKDRNNNEFTMNNKKVTFIIDGNKIIDNKTINFDVSTGEIKYGSDNQVYVRSVTDTSIVIWYEKAEYRLDKVNS